MQSSGLSHFSCRACGHQFSGALDVISKQPTCPKCRTFGQIVDADGRSLSARQNVVRVQHPGARGGPVAPYANEYEDDVVEVAADISYGQKRNTKAIVNTLLLLGLGLGIVITLYVIVTSLKDDRAHQQQQEREVVLDTKEFERAIDEAVGKTRGLLNTIEEVEVNETNNFDEAIRAIGAAGGTQAIWPAAPTPGSPFRSQGFLVKAPDPRVKKTVVTGFVMLLYYKTSEEVERARYEIEKYIGGDSRNYGIYANPSQWFIAYWGVSHGGAVRDKIQNAMRLGSPATFKQFTDRVGATSRE